MTLTLERSALFESDVTGQFGWYVEVGGESLAWRFFEAVDSTLTRLCGQPDLGRIRHFQNPALADLRSICVEPPFNAVCHLLPRDRNNPPSLAIDAWCPGFAQAIGGIARTGHE